jgi:hypothetical protein
LYLESKVAADGHFIVTINSIEKNQTSKSTVFHQLVLTSNNNQGFRFENSNQSEKYILFSDWLNQLVKLNSSTAKQVNSGHFST